MAAIHGLLLVALVAVGLLSGAEAVRCKDGQVAKMFAVVGARYPVARTEYAFLLVVRDLPRYRWDIKWTHFTVTSKEKSCEVKKVTKYRDLKVTTKYTVNVDEFLQGCVATCEWQKYSCKDPRTNGGSLDGAVARAVYAGKEPVKFKTSGKGYRCKKTGKHAWDKWAYRHHCERCTIRYDGGAVYVPKGKRALKYAGECPALRHRILVTDTRYKY